MGYIRVILSGSTGRFKYLMVCAFLFVSASVFAQTATTGNGSWSTGGIWSSGIPGPGDAVTIGRSDVITIPDGYAAQCASIAFGDSRTSSITLLGSASLTVGGAVTIQRPRRNNTLAINVGAGDFSAGSIVLQSNAANRYAQINISTGTVTVTGNITSSGAGSQIIFSDAGTLNAGGTFLSGTAGVFTAASSTVNFNAAGAQTISPFAYTFNNVILSGSGVKTTTNATINGILSMEGTATASAAPTYGAAATLRYNTATPRPAGPEWLNTFVASGGVVIANTGGITLNADKVLNAGAPLTINNGATLTTDTWSLTVNDDFVNSGTLTGGAGTVDVTGSLTNNGTFNAGAGAITVGTNFSNTNIFNASGALNITGNFSNTAGTFTANASTITINGNWTGGGAFTTGTSTVVFAGAGATTINGSNSFNNLSCTTPSKSILVTQGTTQTVGGVFTLDGAAVGTRVSLASTGGVGTTWNLILNGSYACQYVAVQGSKASGTVSFPINPTGSQSNGNNTNWFMTYALTYNGNGNDGGSVPVDGNSPYAQGGTVTVLDNTGNLTKTGSAFNGWNTVANGSGTSYVATDTFLMGTSPVVLYAQWITALTISGTVYTDEAKTTPVAAGTSVALSVNGAASTNTTTNASGQFSFAATTNPNDVILAYLNAPGGVSSYHALNTSATGTNITEGNGNLDLPLTNMLDVSDGSDSGYDIDINWSANGTNYNNTDNDPNAGTDAYNAFNGKINLGTDNAYLNGGSIVVTFSNLDTNKKYTMAMYSSIGGFAQYSNRFVLGGADSATQASSSGATIVDNWTTEYDFDNTTDGYIAKWTDIDPTGTDFTITITSATANFLIGPNAIMLQEQPPAGSTGSLVTVTDGVTDMTGGNQLVMVTDKIILEHQTGTSITNTQLDVIDDVASGDADGITISAGNATFANDRELWISSGKNYTPGGNVTLTDIEFFGTLTGGTDTFTVNGSWNNNGGAFAAGTSTVTFAGATSANIAGNTTFYNFRCEVPGKSMTFAQGSTQTINGIFTIQGDRATTNRVTLASSGGGGTTWNLVINGDHDCNYVDGQGSNVSGTAYLPINPAGYFDNGDNTNWYDPALPEDVVFYDNFENSTLGSASPDRESSNWTDNAGWITTPAETVNTYNHTPGGSQSMYAEPAGAGLGDASWNNPAWGPVDNGVAECWFYDDMNDGGGKRIWASVESSDGMEWAAIGISTVDSTNKYAYHQGSGGAPLTTQVTFIDRSIGWHKATWIRDVNYITLYLDDVQIYQGPNSQLDNFADFDLGSWTYDNPNGTTAMWFDDCVVYRSQHQAAYRWYENDDAQNPTPIDAEDTAITREINTVTRVRIQLQNDMAMDWGTNATYVGLQYRQGTTGSWIDLGASADWEYVNGLGTDGAQIANALLTNTNIREHFVESQPSSQILSATPSDYAEWDFTIQANSNANIGATYYFRMIATDAAGAYLKPFAAYPFLAECQVVSLSMWVWTGAVSNDWNNPANWNQATIPDATSDVIIQTGAARDPRVNIAGAVCKSLVIQTGMTLLLDTASTDLTVTKDITVEGTVTHSNNSAVLNLNGGELLVDAGTYNHTGNGALNAANADLRILNGGAYNFDSQATVTLKDLYVDNFGSFNDSTAAGTLNVQNFNILANGQFISDQIASVYNISGDFLNDGSMSGTTGGVFNFTGTGKNLSGISVTYNFYQANFTGSYTITSTSDITVLDDLTIGATGSLTAGTGTLSVAGDWTNNNAFIHGSGTVEFNGTGLQNITSGGSDWYNLTQTNASVAGVSFLDAFTTGTLTNTTGNSTMTFNAGSTYNITGTGGLTLTGTAGNLVTLASSTPGTMWNINPSGAGWSVDYVDVSDSFNTYEDPILPTNTVDNGTTINWFTFDFDQDEIPDYYEYGYYSTLANDPDSDTDGDGLTLIEEFVLGADPTVATTSKLYVDDNAGYIGDGSVGAPFKYLKDALIAATDGTLIILEPGTYELDNYLLTKRVIIRGDKGAVKTIIHGGAPDGGSSDSGSFLQVASKNFALEHVTMRMFRDDKPIITYTGSNGVEVFMLDSVIFRDNSTQTKAMIAPSATDRHKRAYMYNCLFYDNSSLSGAILDADKDVRAYNNTLVDNTFTSALILDGNGKRYRLYNNILRNSSTEITDNSTGTLIVNSCNVEGGFPGALNSYDSAETFADSLKGYYNLLIGSAGENAGLTTKINWDMDNVSRPQGAAFDVGCYETDPNDQDGDGLTTAQETAAGSSPTNPDSDGDGITDGDEVNTWGTNPLSTNSDGDFIDDGYEPAMGMDPAVNDGVGDIDGVYYTSFENPAQFPVGPVQDTIWGPNGNVNNSNVIKGNMTIENVGAVAAYDGTHVAKCEGNPGGGLIETSYVAWVDRNGLDNYWISISYKMPRAELPTDINEAMNVAGAFFAIDENGYLNIWDPSNEEWLKDTQVIPDDWVRITVHRDHPGKIVNLWIETRQAFANVPIVDPDPTAGTGKFRMSMSSVGEQDSYSDLWSSLPFAPF